MSRDKSKKPWGGRFDAPTDALVERFTASVDFDKRLFRHDIDASVAHAEMLGRVGVIPAEDCRQIVEGLEAVRAEIDQGSFPWREELEDVHMNIEARLVEHIGPVGKKLHTARSRNDQVATDLRLYLREVIDALQDQLRALQSALLDLAEREADSIMPGFTHLQTAQPVTLGHHLLAWFEMIRRDVARFEDCRKRVNVLPLGAAALAGTSFAIDRKFVAQRLGFESAAENSLDAVSDRDFVVEFLACAALLMTHFSRMAEELVLWASPQFDFVELPDAFCTGSSIMPQKKNPDIPELVRGKAGRVCGALVAVLMMLKAQPLAYNRDNQEDKEQLFDAADTVQSVARLLAVLIPKTVFKRDNMRRAAAAGFSTATDLADYLVRAGVPFRDAHEIVGRTVRHALERGVTLQDLELSELQQFSAAIDKDVFEILTVDGSVRSRDHLGGTAPAQVRAAIARARKALQVAKRGS